MPVKRSSSPALVAAVLASEAVRPTSEGTVHILSGLSTPAYRTTVDLPGMMAPPTGVWSVMLSPSPSTLQVKPRSFMRSLASCTDMPMTLGTVVSTPISSSAL